MTGYETNNIYNRADDTGADNTGEAGEQGTS